MTRIHHSHLVRLHPAAYQGWAAVHWTMAVRFRRRGWLNFKFHEAFIEVLAELVQKYGVVVPVYVLMPDHIHILAVGIAEHADQLRWLRALRRRINGLLYPDSLQKQAFDHVLRDEERKESGFPNVLGYICANPVKDGLVKDAENWEFTGSVVPGLVIGDPRNAEFLLAWWDFWCGTRK